MKTPPVLPISAHRRRRTIVISIAAVALIILGGIYYLGRISQRTERLFETGVSHYLSGSALIEEGLKMTSGMGKMTDERARHRRGKQVIRLSERAANHFDRAARDFKRSSDASTFDWEKEASGMMLESVAAAKKGSAAMKAVIDRADETSRLLELVRDGVAKFRQASADSNSLIALNNSGRYTEVKNAAPQAALLFSEAKAKIIEAEKMDPGTGLGEFITRIASGERLAVALGGMADTGIAKRTDEYNRLSNESNALIKELAQAEKIPLVADPLLWSSGRLDKTVARVKEQLLRSEKIKIKALDLWSDNT